MAYAGVTVFLIFFGVSLLDALWGGHWIRAGFWIVIGAAFWALDRMRREGRSKPQPPGAAR